MKENKYAISTHHLWIDLNNRKFGYLKVLGFLHVERKWECLCNCGKLTIVRGSHLLNGNVNSCGCLAKEKLIERNNIWVNFKGEKRLLVDLAEEFGFSYESLRRILSKKSDIEKEKYLIKKINKNY